MEVLIPLFVLLSIARVARAAPQEPANVTSQAQPGTHNMSTRPTTVVLRPATELLRPRLQLTSTNTPRLSFAHDCDYHAQFCLKAYDTGSVCGRAFYYVYHTFDSYCLLDYVNCMEKFQVWQVVHMGGCIELPTLQTYFEYPHDNDIFLEQYYVEH